MSILDYNKSASANSVPKSVSSMTEDVQTSSMINGDEHAPKARKPYTITKQRERWTEEEHKKFTEALRRYGRAWRRIEEFVGTKTAVQIRSHAQKFFSKVVKESKAIEIPPPRPKRKPAHPYPRKVGSLTTGTLGHSCSPTELENGSPTSILNSFTCENLFYVSEFANRCSSPTSSGTGSNEEGTSRMEASVPCIKLFGKTVTVADKDKPDMTPDHDDHVNKRSNPKHYPTTSSFQFPWWSCYSNVQFPFVHKMNSGTDLAMKSDGVLRNNGVEGFMAYKNCVVRREGQEPEREDDDYEDGDDKLIELKL